MGDVLSQQEIDMLLSALSSGEVSAEEIKEEKSQEDKVKPYDFKHPNRVSKDQLRVIHMIQENFARVYGTTLSGFLRTIVEIEVVSVDQVSYGEFIRSLPSPTSLDIFSLSPLEGRGILQLDLSIVFIMLDRLLGGPGEPIDKTRELTDVEEVVYNKVVSRALNDFKEVWSHIIEMNPKLEGREYNPQFAQIVSPNEMTVLITLEVKIGKASGIMNICIPYIVLEPVIPKLSAQYWFSTGKKSGVEDLAIVKRSVNFIRLPVVVYLGNAVLTVRELLHLKLGDIIRLDTSADASLLIKVGGVPKFYAKPGLRGKKIALMITSKIEEKEVAM